MAKADLDTREFISALKLYAKATGKTAQATINRAGGNLALRSIQKTKKAKLSQMKASKAWDPDARPANNRTRYHYALARLRGQPTDRGSVNSFYKKRRQSSGYIAVGFANAAKDFGKKTRVRPIRGGDAARGFGRKATRRRLNAMIFNYSTGAGTVGAQGMNAAMAFVSADMKRFALRRMSNDAKKYSAK